MIDREDMLALTRRMTVKRTSMTRIAGGYMDSDGCIEGTFNSAKTCRLQRKFRLQKRIKTCKNTNFCWKICKMTACGSF